MESNREDLVESNQNDPSSILFNPFQSFNLQTASPPLLLGCWDGLLEDQVRVTHSGAGGVGVNIEQSNHLGAKSQWERGRVRPSEERNRWWK